MKTTRKHLLLSHHLLYFSIEQVFSFIALGNKDGYMSSFRLLFLLCDLYSIFWKKLEYFLVSVKYREIFFRNSFIARKHCLALCNYITRSWRITFSVRSSDFLSRNISDIRKFYLTLLGLWYLSIKCIWYFTLCFLNLLSKSHFFLNVMQQLYECFQCFSFWKTSAMMYIYETIGRLSKNVYRRAFRFLCQMHVLHAELLRRLLLTP